MGSYGEAFLERNVLMVNRRVIQGEMHYNDEVLLTYRIEYPEFINYACGEAVMIFNNCQKEKALAYQRHCEMILYPMAVEDYRNSIVSDFPVHTYEALVVYKVTYNKSCVVSLYYDIYEYTGGAHGSTLRCADTCNLESGSRIDLNQLILCPPDYKTYLLSQITEQIGRDSSIYFENYANLALTNFNEDSFYCTQEGIVFFYQQYDIAPYSSGIREFLIPYSDCVLEPFII